MAGPGDPSRLSLAQRIDALCDRFEKEWKAGKKPRIEDYVAKATGQARASLLASLLRVELELLEASGTVPDFNVYSSRFPQDHAVVAGAFNQAIRDTTAPSATDTASHHGPATDQARQTKKLGRFELQTVLGQGAMGKVYKARDPQLDRDVAIKVPIKEAFRSEEERDRFLREAGAAGSIQHPNICPIYDVVQEGSFHFIVMALIDGKPLSSLLKERKGPMPPHQSAVLVRKLALTMQAAHDKGVVHRDLKPGNVMLDRQRKDLVIMDFGLARRLSKDEARMTTEGLILGTPAYMAPEQARGEADALGPACDIYALGVILYEMMTGRLPFEGTAVAVVSQVINQAPPTPSSVRPGVDTELEKICLKAMAKKASDRFASMQEMADALGRYLRAKPVEVAAPGGEAAAVVKGEATETARMLEEIVARLEEMPEKSRRGRRLIAVGLLTVAAAVLVFALIYLLSDKGGPTVQVQIGGLTFINDNSVKFFLDGKEISAEKLQGTLDLKIGDHQVEVRRDGKTIEVRPFKVAKEDANQVIVVKAQDPPDGEEGEIATFVGFEGPVYSIVYMADGRHFVAGVRNPMGNRGSLQIWNMQEAKQIKSITLKIADQIPTLYPLPHALELAPNGRHVACGWLHAGHGDLKGNQSALALHDLTTGEEVWRHSLGVLEMDGETRSAVFSPRGDLVLGSAAKGITRVFEVKKGERVGSLQGSLACFSPDGKSVLSVDDTGKTLYLWDINQQPYRRQKGEFTGPTNLVRSIAFFPDGKRIVAGGDDGVVRVWDIETRKETITFKTDPSILSVCVSPDGSRLLSGSSDGKVRYWDVRGEKLLTEFAHGKAGVFMVSLSPGGRRALTAGEDRTVRWWQLPK